MDVIDEDYSDSAFEPLKSLKVPFLITVLSYLVHVVTAISTYKYDVKAAKDVLALELAGVEDPAKLLAAQFQNPYSSVLLITMIFGVVFYCIWFFRALENIRINRVELLHSTGWYVGSIFVPIVNLIIPFRGLLQLMKTEKGVNPIGSWAKPIFYFYWVGYACYWGVMGYLSFMGIKYSVGAEFSRESDFDKFSDLMIVANNFEINSIIYSTYFSLLLIPFIAVMFAITKKQGSI